MLNTTLWSMNFIDSWVIALTDIRLSKENLHNKKQLTQITRFKSIQMKNILKDNGEKINSMNF